MEKQIRRWLLLSGVDPSHPRLVRAIPRWERRLQEMGVTEVMPPLVSRGPMDDRVSSLLCLWVKQAMAPQDRDGTAEHELRNLTGTRTWKVRAAQPEELTGVGGSVVPSVGIEASEA